MPSPPAPVLAGSAFASRTRPKGGVRLQLVLPIDEFAFC
jgi:hypothetical protein